MGIPLEVPAVTDSINRTTRGGTHNVAAISTAMTPIQGVLRSFDFWDGGKQEGVSDTFK